MLLPVYWV